MKNKTIIISIFACLTLTFFTCITFSLTEETIQNETPTWKLMTSLPLQSGCCEVIGVGRVTNTWQDGKGVFLTVDNYWRGNPGSNTLSVYTSINQPPVTNTPLVFFTTKFGISSGVGFYEPMYSYIFDDVKRNSRNWTPKNDFHFYDYKRSWFHINETNANLVSFASNLVFASESHNTNLFYKTIRDGFNQNPKNSRIWDDSYYAFFCSEYFMTTNFWAEIWTDPLLKDRTRILIYNFYHIETGIWLPPP